VSQLLNNILFGQELNASVNRW